MLFQISLFATKAVEPAVTVDLIKSKYFCLPNTSGDASRRKPNIRSFCFYTSSIHMPQRPKPDKLTSYKMLCKVMKILNYEHFTKLNCKNAVAKVSHRLNNRLFLCRISTYCSLLVQVQILPFLR